MAANSRNPTMALRATQLGLRSSGGSVRDPPAAPAVVVRGRFQLQGRSTGTGASWRVHLRLWHGSDPKSTAVAAATWLRAEPGQQGRSAQAGRAGPGHGAEWPRPVGRLQVPAPCKAGPDPASGPGLPTSGGTQAGRGALPLCWRRRAPRPGPAFTGDGRIRAPAALSHPACGE